MEAYEQWALNYIVTNEIVQYSFSNLKRACSIFVAYLIGWSEIVREGSSNERVT